MHLTDEAGRASTRRADSALGYLPAITIANLTGTDANMTDNADRSSTSRSRTFGG
jgi:hypothetical protein